MPEQNLRWYQHYARGLGTTTRNNTVAYGYTVGASATFGVLVELTGAPSVAEIFLYVIGTSVAFTVVNAVVTAGYRRRLPDEPAVVVALATSFSVFSISAAVGAAALVAWALGGWIAWLLASFAFSALYLLAVGLETAIAAEAHEAGGAKSGG